MHLCMKSMFLNIYIHYICACMQCMRTLYICIYTYAVYIHIQYLDIYYIDTVYIHIYFSYFTFFLSENVRNHDVNTKVVLCTSFLYCYLVCVVLTNGVVSRVD